MKFLFSAFLILQATQSFADLTGKWIGTGQWLYEGSGADCQMNMSFTETATTLERKAGLFDCSVVALDVLPEKFTKSGTNILNDENKIVGTYLNNVLTLTEVYDENVNILSTIKVDGLHFDYDERWIEKSGNEIYHISGRLFTDK